MTFVRFSMKNWTDSASVIAIPSFSVAWKENLARKRLESWVGRKERSTDDSHELKNYSVRDWPDEV